MDQNLFINQLKRRDPQALNTLVKEYNSKVFRVCLGYLQNEHDAADVTQEVFIKVLEKIEQYKGDSKISTWIIRIAINLSLNYLRDNKKRLFQEDVEKIHIVDNQSEDISSQEIRKLLRQSIFSLPDKQRKVFILNYYIELSYKEISDTTGYSISSIESLLFRARKKLRELLGDFYKKI
jgi:RNA polymerase sigma-70 factor (ECF subfamily)